MSTADEPPAVKGTGDGSNRKERVRVHIRSVLSKISASSIPKD